MKNIKIGEYALFGESKLKRIYLGTFNGLYLVVQASYETNLMEG